MTPTLFGCPPLPSVASVTSVYALILESLLDNRPFPYPQQSTSNFCVRARSEHLKRIHSTTEQSSSKKHGMSAQNTLAKSLKSLHVPGRPLVLANIYDTLSAQAVAQLPSCKALATASYSVARANNTQDDDMTMDINLEAVRKIAPVAQKHQKALTVDVQDGYGSNLDQAIARLVRMGVVGVNLEDVDKETQTFYSIEEASARIRKTLAVAENEGVPDFTVNARVDTLVHGGKLDEVLRRGKAYLSAGATTVFVWGGSKRGVSRKEVEEMTKEFGGKLNVSLKMAPNQGNLTVKELADIGVARISIGPALQFEAMEAFKKGAEKLLTS